MDLNMIFSYLLSAGVSLFVFLFVISRFFKFRKYPYIKKRYLLSRNEREFYEILKESVNDNFLIFSKVRLGDIVIPKRTRLDWNSYFWQVTNKHVDFVLCTRYSEPVLAIELDDHSHLKPDRIERDVFVNGVLKDSGLPLLRVKQRRSYDKTTLEKEIKRKILSLTIAR